MFLGLTAEQAIAIAIVVGMLGFFIWDRWRYDVVALGALLTAVVVGVVPDDKAFVGFSDQVIIVIAAVLVVSKSIARSGILDRVARRMLKGVNSPSLQVGGLSAPVALMSALSRTLARSAFSCRSRSKLLAAPSCRLLSISCHWRLLR